MEAPAIDNVSFDVIDAVWNPPGNRYSYYRILVASTTIKYLAFRPRNLSPLDLPDLRGEMLGFTTVPSGDWNMGRLKYDKEVTQLTLESTETAALKGVDDVWHPARVDYLSLGEASHRDELQCAGDISAAIYRGQLGVDPVLASVEWYPDDIFRVTQDTLVYSHIEGHDIGPRFLAHITENGDRVCGYILESLPVRYATLDDLPACQAVLAKLHSLQIVHGGLALESLLITGGRALLHGFAGSFSTDEQRLFDEEMASVKDILQCGPSLAQQLTVELNAEISAISRRDNGIHPEVFRQAAEYGKIIILEEEHKKLLYMLREKQRETRSYSKPIETKNRQGL